MPRGPQLVGGREYSLGPETPSGKLSQPVLARERQIFFDCTMVYSWCPGMGSALWGWRSVHFQFIYEFYPESGRKGYEADLIFMSTLKPAVAMSALQRN